MYEREGRTLGTLTLSTQEGARSTMVMELACVCDKFFNGNSPEDKVYDIQVVL